MRMRGAAAARRLPILMISAGLVACGGSEATASDAPVSATPSALASAAQTGQPGTAVPDGFPVIGGGESVTPPADPDLLARWLSGANGAEVYDFYVEALPPAGFAIQQLAPGGAAAVIGFSTPDGRLFEIALTATEGGTQIDLRVPES